MTSRMDSVRRNLPHKWVDLLMLTKKSFYVCVSMSTLLFRSSWCKRCILEMVEKQTNKQKKKYKLSLRSTGEPTINSAITPGWFGNNCCSAALHNKLKLTTCTFKPKLMLYVV